MAKDTFYFQHDYEPTADPKIQALLSIHGAVGYGLYWRIVEMLHSNETHTLQTKPYLLIAIASQMKVDVDTIALIINDCVSKFELLVKDGETIYCNRVNRNIEKRNDIREKRVKAGKARAAHAEQMLTNAKQNPAKESKEKEIKENIISTNVLEQSPNSLFDPLSEYRKMPKDKQSLLAYLAREKPNFIDPYIDVWNIFASDFKKPTLRAISDNRKRKLMVRIKDKNFNFLQILQAASKSQFLKESTFFSFDWVIENDTNYLKVIEGNYK